MAKKIIISESELINIIKKSLLNEDNSPKNILNIQKALKSKGIKYAKMLGTSGPKKDGVDGKWGLNTIKTVQQFQIDNGLRAVGYVGPRTAKLLGVNPMDKMPNFSKKTDNQLVDVKNTKFCKATTKEVCDKISPKKNTKLGKTSIDGCAMWARIELEKMGATGISGNAWQWLNKFKEEKFNIYKDPKIWEYIHTNLQKQQIKKMDMNVCFGPSSDNIDKPCGKIAEIITNSMPSTSSFNMSSLKVGDAVGLYHKNSDNKSTAFSEKAIKNTKAKVNSEGYLIYEPNNLFTFNSHVGYVGAIKDGIPIIFHNVHNTINATPATELTSKENNDMIVWIASTNASDVQTNFETTSTDDEESDLIAQIGNSDFDASES